MAGILKYDELPEAEPMEHYERGCQLPTPEPANRRAPHRAGHVAGEKGWPARAHPARGGAGVRASLCLVAPDAAPAPLDPPCLPAGMGRHPVSCAELLAG